MATTTPSHDRRERERQDLRARIMDAARDQFAAHGYDAVSMRKIAEAIAYSPTAIYHHFKDKAALFRELCRCDFGALAEATRAMAAVADPVERIQRLGRAYTDFGTRFPNHYRLMFMTPHAPDAGPDAADLARRGDPDADAYAVLRSAVADAVAAGRFRPGLTDVGLVTQTLWAAVHGVVSLQITKAEDPWITWAPLPARVAAMLDAILNGMLAGPDRAAKRGRKAGGP